MVGIENISQEACLLTEIKALLISNSSKNDSYNQKVVSPLNILFQETFSYNINDRLFNTVIVGSGTVSVVTTMAELSSGTTIGSTILLISKRRLHYRHGQSGLCRVSALFSAPISGTTAFVGMGSPANGFFFGFDTNADFGVLHRNTASGSLVETFIKNSQWSGDPTAITTTNLNNYDIQFKAGVINYFVNLVLVHTINADITLPILGTPNLPFRAECDNGATTDDIIIKVGDVGLFIEGENKITGVINSVSNEKSIASGVRTSILTIRNKATYASKANTNIILPKIWTIGIIDTDRSFLLELVINTTLGGTPAFTDIDTNNSIVDFDVAGTTATGGDVVMVTSLNEGATNSVIYLDTLDFILAPTDTLTLVATLLVAGNFDVTSAITWQEDL